MNTLNAVKTYTQRTSGSLRESRRVKLAPVEMARATAMFFAVEIKTRLFAGQVRLGGGYWRRWLSRRPIGGPLNRGAGEECCLG